ncbi:MAG: PrgI family protein, partial [archaeon]
MYEIPQSLEYKEKILFGLTFQQILAALPFCLVLLIVFKLPVSMTTKAMLCTPLVVVAALFIFFDLGKHLKNMLYFFRFRKAKLLD